MSVVGSVPKWRFFHKKRAKERGCLNLILNGFSSASCTSKEVTELSNHSAYVWEWGLLWQCEAFICLQKMINIQCFKYSQSLLKFSYFLWNEDLKNCQKLVLTNFKIVELVLLTKFESTNFEFCLRLPSNLSKSWFWSTSQSWNLNFVQNLYFIIFHVWFLTKIL